MPSPCACVARVPNRKWFCLLWIPVVLGIGLIVGGGVLQGTTRYLEPAWIAGLVLMLVGVFTCAVSTFIGMIAGETFDIIDKEQDEAARLLAHDRYVAAKAINDYIDQTTPVKIV